MYWHKKQENTSIFFTIYIENVFSEALNSTWLVNIKQYELFTTKI